MDISPLKTTIGPQRGGGNARARQEVYPERGYWALQARSGSTSQTYRLAWRYRPLVRPFSEPSHVINFGREGGTRLTAVMAIEH